MFDSLPEVESIPSRFVFLLQSNCMMVRGGSTPGFQSIWVWEHHNIPLMHPLNPVITNDQDIWTKIIKITKTLNANPVLFNSGQIIWNLRHRQGVCHLNVAVCEVMRFQRVCVDSAQSCTEMMSRTNTISDSKRKQRAKRRAEAERWREAHRRSSD